MAAGAAEVVLIAGIAIHIGVAGYGQLGAEANFAPGGVAFLAHIVFTDIYAVRLDKVVPYVGHGIEGVGAQAAAGAVVGQAGTEAAAQAVLLVLANLADTVVEIFETNVLVYQLCLRLNQPATLIVGMSA